MKFKLLIFTWLLTITIFLAVLYSDLKQSPTNGQLLDIEIRMDILEADLQRNRDRVTREIRAFHRNRRIVPVGRGVLLAVTKEKKE